MLEILYLWGGTGGVQLLAAEGGRCKLTLTFFDMGGYMPPQNSWVWGGTTIWGGTLRGYHGGYWVHIMINFLRNFRFLTLFSKNFRLRLAKYFL